MEAPAGPATPDGAEGRTNDALAADLVSLRNSLNTPETVGRALANFVLTEAITRGRSDRRDHVRATHGGDHQDRATVHRTKIRRSPPITASACSASNLSAGIPPPPRPRPPEANLAVAERVRQRTDPPGECVGEHPWLCGRGPRVAGESRRPDRRTVDKAHGGRPRTGRVICPTSGEHGQTVVSARAPPRRLYDSHYIPGGGLQRYIDLSVISTAYTGKSGGRRSHQVTQPSEKLVARFRAPQSVERELARLG